MPKYVLDSVHLPNTPRMNVVAKNIVKKKNLKSTSAQYNEAVDKQMSEKMYVITVYLWYERFSISTYNKLKYPYKILKKINNNIYMTDLSDN